MRVPSSSSHFLTLSVGVETRNSFYQHPQCVNGFYFHESIQLRNNDSLFKT
jgi:hypothetical protein